MSHPAHTPRKCVTASSEYPVASSEKFGDGIYYRLIYSTREKKKWEFLLVFEEQLLMNTIGSMMETKAKNPNRLRQALSFCCLPPFFRLYSGLNIFPPTQDRMIQRGKEKNVHFHGLRSVLFCVHFTWLSHTGIRTYSMPQYGSCNK